ncbi:SpoIIE family protein phosphatase [Fluviicola sp.]|uniref:SpoIIE family protein phosphatase n=1 Tax=Fluviicola sp. TaxID=1917219 RepID=UPI0031E2399E
MKRLLLSSLLLGLNSVCLAQTVSYRDLFDRIRKNPSDTTTVTAFLQKIKKDGAETDSTALKAEKFYGFISDTKNHRHVAQIAIFIGSQYNNVGKYSQALKYEIIAEKRLKRIPLTHLLGTTYSLMGNTYFALKNEKKQEESFRNCYDIGVKLGNQMTIAVGATGLGNYYSSIKEYEASNKWNYKALAQFDAIHNNLASGIIRVNIAANYRKLHQMDKAKKMLRESEKNVLLSENNYAKSGYHQEVGDQFMVEKKYAEAIPAYKTALDLVLIDKANHNISDLSKLLSEAYAKNHQYKESVDALKMHLQYKDSVFNETSNQQLLSTEEQYKTEKKDAEIKLLSQANALHESELDRKQFMIWAFGFAGLLLVGVGIYLLKSIRRKNKTNELLALKNTIIEEKQQEILSSINYAKRIQYTLLANDSLLESNLKKHFVLFQPKDIVSGDFYWAIKTKTHFFLAVCDCTGHGVPGAFMSLLNINFLKEAITEKHLSDPGQILDFVRKRLIENLDQGKHFDGMDGILLSMNLETREIQYAGANNGPVIIRNEEIIELPYDKMPVGNGIRTNMFQTHALPHQTGDWLYLFTDGYADQFGGLKGKKFKYSKLKELLLNTSKKPENEQHSILRDTFNQWKSDLEQVDDICVFGIGL